MAIRLHCPNCGRLFNKPQVWPFQCTCKTKIQDESLCLVAVPSIQIEDGPGSELKLMFDELQIKEKEGCSCKSLRVRMNYWGVAGCIRNKEWIVTQLEVNAQQYSWFESIMVVKNMIKDSQLRKIILTSILPGNRLFDLLVTEAISRANQKDCVCDLRN